MSNVIDNDSGKQDAMKIGKLNEKLNFNQVFRNDFFTVKIAFIFFIKLKKYMDGSYVIFHIFYFNCQMSVKMIPVQTPC